MELLRRIAAYIRTMYGNMSAVQRVAIVALVIVVLAVIVWGTTSISTDGWTKIVGTEASKEERSEVIKKLTEKNVRYQLKNEEVYVQKEQADQVVLELHGEGVFSETMLFKFLDEPNITSSKWQQEKRYQVAIQRKLERMIMSVESVKRASVQLTPGDEKDKYLFQGNPPTASVTVELRPGKELARSNVVAIARLVANGMTGLKPHNVLIMDTAGKPYRLPQANTDVELAESRLDMERQYAEWLRSEILRVLPDAMVGLRPELSGESQRLRRDTPGKVVPVHKEQRSESEKDEQRGGTTGPFKEGQQNQESTGTTTVRDNSESLTRNYAGSEVVEIVTPFGTFKGLTVSVTLPIPVAEGEDEAAALNKHKSRLDEYKQSIMKAVGLTNPDLLAVTFVATRKPSALVALTWKDRFSEIMAKWGGSLILFLLAVFALIIVYRLLKAALPRNVVEDIEALRRKLGEEVVVGPSPELALAEEEIGRMKMTIREMVTKNPRNVASIIRRWITGK